MLVQLIYVSTPVGGVQPPEFFIANQRRNRDRGITGIVVTSPHAYVQLMEGERSSVCSLFTKIAGDPRHKDMIILRYHEMKIVEFPEWDLMCMTDQEMLGSPSLSTHLSRTIPPDQMTGPQALAMMRRIAATIRAEKFLAAARTDGST
jgi:hypothetical protein